MTLATPGQCSEARARHITEQLRQSLTISANLLMEAYEERVWVSLGYGSWQDYTNAELGEVRLRLPREDRREVVATMTEAGMSTRAIGAALGVDHKTVINDRRGEISPPAAEPVDAEIVDEPDAFAKHLAQSDADYAWQAADMEAELRAERATSTVGPEPANTVLGTDGKTYPVQSKQPAPRRRPLPDAFFDAAHDLRKVTERIERLGDDDRFPQNAEQVAARHRNDLLRAIDALQGVVNRLPSA